MTLHGRTCLACGSAALAPILEIERVPVLINQLCSTHSEALEAPTAPIDLTYCEDCTHVFNRSFDGSLVEYGPDYENSLHHSGRFRAYASDLVRTLAGRHSLAGGTIVEIGCGDGRVLRELCELTGARGYGFDPSVRTPGPVDDRVVLSNGSYFDATGVPKPDLVVNRHVLEHLDDPTGFLSAVAQAAGPGTALYIEVPNALYTLRDLGIWDLIYEHPSYFTADSLTRVARGAGFDVQRVDESFGGQFLGLHATSRLDSSMSGLEPDADAATAELAGRFAAEYRRKVEAWDRKLSQAGIDGGRVVLWGAGSKGSTFMNVVPAGARVERVVDINPAKRGKFVSGAGASIVSPDDLRADPPTLVVVMNPIYLNEIAETLAAIAPKAELATA